MSHSVIMLFDWLHQKKVVDLENSLWKAGVKKGVWGGGGGLVVVVVVAPVVLRQPWGGGGSLSRVSPHVNYLLFALDNPEARCAARNENPESQSPHLKKRSGGVGGGAKQCRCHYHIISA